MTLNEFIVWASKALPPEVVRECWTLALIQWRIVQYVEMRKQETNDTY